MNKETLGCAVFLLSPLIWAVAAALEAWVFLKLWVWYVTPAFSINAPSMLHAVGIILLVQLVTHQKVSQEEYDDPAKNFAYIIGSIFMRPLFTLTFGALAKLIF